LGIYNRISKVRRSALILEADIELQSSNIQQVKKVLEQIREPDFLHLARYSTEFEKFELNSNLYVVYTASGFWGTAAYYISPNVADALILHHSRFIDLADNWQEFFVKSSFTPFYAPIFDHTGDESSIAGNRILAQNPSLKDAIRLRFLRKRMTMLARLRFQKQISFAKRIVDIPK
jgi:GR25 family glycosyltransferase involved in LPS biosynthesis